MNDAPAGLGFLAYLLWGNLLEYVPVLSAFAHDGFRATRALNFLYYNQDGVFGIMANVLATYIILFVIFGAFLERSGAQRFFIDFPPPAARPNTAGPGTASATGDR